jgi:signal transduction histidine kinase
MTQEARTARAERWSDSRAFITASGAMAAVFGLAVSFQSVYIYTWVAPGGTRGMLAERITANLVSLSAAILVLALLLWSRWGPSLHEWWRPKVLAGVFLVAILTGLLRSGLQLLLGVYRDPGLQTVLVETGTTTLALAVCATFGFSLSAARRRAREEERAHADQRHRADLALQSLQGEELRVKREVAEGLHGTLQQHLVLIGAQLTAVTSALEQGGPEVVSDATRTLRSLGADLRTVRERDVRELSRLLSPPLLEVGIAPSIRAILQRLPPSITTSLDVAPDFRLLDDPIDNVFSTAERAVLVRTLEEGVTNALTHGAADRLAVELRVAAPSTDRNDASAGTVELQVTDNGSGLPHGVEPSGGLLQLERRASAFGGSLRIDPAPGDDTGGAVLTLTMPYRAPASR